MNFKLKDLYLKLSRLDKSLIIIVYMLTTISSIFVYSATRSYKYLQMNIIWTAVGTGLMLLFAMVNYKRAKNYTIPIYIFAISMMVYVKIFGKTILGAKRWVSIFGFTLQPSEFAKILIVFILSYITVTRFRKGIRNIIDIIHCFLYITPIILLILTQPDLGTTLIITFSYFCILFLSEANIKPLIYLLIFAIISAYPVYRYVLSDYQKTRIEVFLNPEKDIKNKGWRITQSKISIGSGKLWGTGVLNGSQSRLKFLPEPQTDFIFSVIAEETGFFGSTVVISLYFWLLFTMLQISKKIEDDYGRLIIFGIVGIF